MNYNLINDRQDYVEGYALIKSVNIKTTQKGDSYLDIILNDATDEVNAKLWSYSESQHGKFESRQLIKFRGYLQEYNGVTQLKLERLREVTPEDDVNISDYIKCAPIDTEKAYNNIISFINDYIVDEEYKTLVKCIYNDYNDLLITCPAARSMHHAVRGGLLWHICGMLDIATGIAAVYPKEINRDLLFTGVLLHDIGKIEEFGRSNAAFGMVDKYSTEGTLLGHLVIDALIVEKYDDVISEEKLLLVKHMLISHHQKPEWGACVKPMTLEAELLSRIDGIDAAVNEIVGAQKDINVGEFTQPIFALENRIFYKTK